ncbi:hypothetical protein [Candidatus Darwinibacter acetoxidans]
MRIYPDLPMIRLDGLTQPLLQLFQGSSKLEGVIKEITPASILLQLGQAELELPLESSRPDVRAWLREGLKVELHRQQGVFILKAQPAASQPEPAALAVRPLDEALLALDIPPTPEALLTAKTLLEQGFPLQKEHLWVLLPWAEQGRLEEALQLLQAGLRATPALVELVSELREKPPGQAVQEQVRQELPLELQESLTHPSVKGRTAWSGRVAQTEVGHAVIRLLAAEQMLNSLLAAQSSNTDLVFFLPFLQGEDLFASWVKISRDSPEREAELQGFRLQVVLPTESFGLVTADLFVQGKTVRLHLGAEENDQLLADGAGRLTAELGASCWQLTEVTVGGLVECARQSLYAMIGR